MMRTLLISAILFGAAASPALAQRAVIRGLDKVTGHAENYTLTLNRATRIGPLEVVARSCTKAAPEEQPEVRIYVEVFDRLAAREGQEAERREVFHGWLFASSPGISAMDHPAYDIWAVDCR